MKKSLCRVEAGSCTCIVGLLLAKCQLTWLHTRNKKTHTPRESHGKEGNLCVNCKDSGKEGGAAAAAAATAEEEEEEEEERGQVCVCVK